MRVFDFFVIFVLIEIFFQGKFAAFVDYQKNFNSDDFDYDELQKSDYVFMRWKEHFLVTLL